MQTLQFQGTMTALSSIAHSGGESLGITTKLRREKVVQPDGSVEDVPVLSGNGLRGLLRDRGMLHFCRALGYGVNEQSGEIKGLTLPAFYFLFSGGSLTGEGTKGLDLAYARRLRELIPLVSIFGGAVGNQTIPSKLKVGKAIPICTETAHLLPESFAAQAKSSVWAYLQEEMYTRKDDEKNEHLRKLLDGQTQLALTGGIAKATLTESATPQQMMYYVETFAAGTPFYWRLTLDDVTDVELEAFLTTLVQFSRMPYVGGKSGTGLGEVAIQFDGWTRIDSRLAPQGEAVSFTLGTAYQRHLEQHGEAIRAELAAMQ